MTVPDVGAGVARRRDAPRQRAVRHGIRGRRAADPRPRHRPPNRPGARERRAAGRRVRCPTGETSRRSPAGPAATAPCSSSTTCRSRRSGRSGQSEGADFSAVCALADGTLVTGDEDGALTHWDRAYAVPLRRWRAPDDHRYALVGAPRRTIETVLALPGGKRVASLAAGRWLSVWNVQTAKLEWCAEVDGLQALASVDGCSRRGHAGRAHHVPRSRDGRRPAGGRGRAAGVTTSFALHAPSMTAVWATQIPAGDSSSVAPSCTPHPSPARRSSPSSAGRTRSGSTRWRSMRRARCSSPGRWTARCASGICGRRRRAAMRQRHRDRVTALELFDGERKLLTASNDGAVKVWRTTDGAPLRELRASSGRTSA